MSKPKSDRALRHGEGSVIPKTNKDGSEVFDARWREVLPDGTVCRRSKTFRTRDLAEDELRKIARDKRDGRHRSSSRQTVADLVATWIERGEGRWKPSTTATYRQRAGRHVYPTLGAKTVESLTAPQLQAWVDAMRREGLNASTIESAVRVMLGALNEAVRLGIIAHNPARGLTKPSMQPRQIPTWSGAEVRRVMTVVRDDSFWFAFYLFALNTGVRPGELRALMWDDLDLDRGLVRIRRTLTKDATGHVVMGTVTKTGRTRAIALPAMLVDALRQWKDDYETRRDEAREWNDTGVVFDRGDGTYLPLTTLQHHHDRFTALAGVKRITPHQLRHTNATLDLEAGVSPKIVAERLGHRKIQTTLDLYSHVSMDLQQSVAEAFAERVFADPLHTTTSLVEDDSKDRLDD
ncbi:MAG: tyrosine-type recombinase/integrase [Thermomicrobiales bacterium]